MQREFVVSDRTRVITCRSAQNERKNSGVPMRLNLLLTLVILEDRSRDIVIFS